MKKLLLIVIILAVIGFAGYYLFGSDATNPTGTTPTQTSQTGPSQPDPSNATFQFSDAAVTLSSGKNERPVAPGSAFMEETILLENMAYGDLNGDGKNDTALLLARFGAGSGTFVYAAAFISGPVGHRGTNAVFVGDRISPQDISISNGTITVEYLDRSPDEPMTAEPTIESSKSFSLQNDTLVEL